MGLKEEAEERTAFITPGLGLYEFILLPFGLCNAPGTFQHLADTIFQGMKLSEVLVYLDDIVVFSPIFKERLVSLEKVFQRLRQTKLTLKTSKCFFGQTKIKLLGHVVGRDGIATDNSKIEAIKNFPEPTSVKKIQSFLGLCNFYRKFIMNFSLFARPLFEVTSKATKFCWGKEQQEAFNLLKEKLTTAPVLAHYNPHKGCELRTDASGEDIGAILLQEKDAEKHPVAFISRSLTKAEKNYGISQLAAVAAVWALTYLRYFTYGQPVNIVTEHHVLSWLKSIRDVTGRLARWAIKLSEYDYTVSYKSGAKQVDVDCFSRNPTMASELVEGDEDPLEVPTYLMEAKDLRKEQEQDPWVSDILTAAYSQTLNKQTGASMWHMSRVLTILLGMTQASTRPLC